MASSGGAEVERIRTAIARVVAAEGPHEAVAAVAREAAWLCHAPLAAVTALAPGGDHLALLDVFGTAGRLVERVLPATGSLNGRVIASGRSFQTADVRRDKRPIPCAIAERNGVRSVLIVPLPARGRPAGTLAVARRRPQPFSAHERAVLAEFAGIAALALENLRLREQLARAIDAAGGMRVDAPGAVLPRLTRREEEIVRLLAADRTGPEIAAALGLSVHTVRHHIERLKRRCGQRTLHGLTSRLLHALVAREWA
jgi:GAF domain-containing protein